jgi:hypothetical protein
MDLGELRDELLQLKQRAAPWGFGLAVNSITVSAPEDDTENDLLIDPLHDRAIEKAPE